MLNEGGKGRMVLEGEYSNYFTKFFDNIKKEFNKSIAFKQTEELSSGELAFKDAIDSLPCPVSVLRLKINIEKYKVAENNIYHLIKYDFSNFGEFSVKYYGGIDLDEIEGYIDLLKVFDINKKTIEDLRDFKTLGYGDPAKWFWVWIVPYDILKNPEEHVHDFLLWFWMTFGDEILKKFERKVDYNAKYGLKSDPVLSLPELLKKDKVFSGFVKIGKNGRRFDITIEDLQKHISAIQLIPNVPKQVEKILNAAKRLYIFGYFEYYFFTISDHYAFLALESALRNKYNDIYGEPKKYIPLFTVIRELAVKGIIPKGEEKLYDVGRELRNALSHLVNPHISSPSSRTMERVAYQINQIYDNRMN